MPTPDITPANTTLRLGGKTRTLRYTTLALSRLEGQLGESLFSVMENAGDSFSVSQILAFVWAGLQHYKPAPSIEVVAAMMDESYEEVSLVQMAEAALNALVSAGAISALAKEADVAEGNAEAVTD